MEACGSLNYWAKFIEGIKFDPVTKSVIGSLNLPQYVKYFVSHHINNNVTSTLLTIYS